MKYSKLIALALGAFMLAACGGGGGDSSGADDASGGTGGTGGSGGSSDTGGSGGAGGTGGSGETGGSGTETPKDPSADLKKAVKEAQNWRVPKSFKLNVKNGASSASFNEGEKINLAELDIDNNIFTNDGTIDKDGDELPIFIVRQDYFSAIISPEDVEALKVYKYEPKKTDSIANFTGYALQAYGYRTIFGEFSYKVDFANQKGSGEIEKLQIKSSDDSIDEETKKLNEMLLKKKYVLTSDEKVSGEGVQKGTWKLLNDGTVEDEKEGNTYTIHLAGPEHEKIVGYVKQADEAAERGSMLIWGNDVANRPDIFPFKK